MAKHKNHFEKLIVCSILSLLLFFIWAKPHIIPTNVVGVVTEKNHKNDIYKILVRLEDRDFVETLQNSDVAYMLKFNSGDIQANVEVGKKYTFRVVGRRNHFLSAYRKIIAFNKEQE